MKIFYDEEKRMSKDGSRYMSAKIWPFICCFEGSRFPGSVEPTITSVLAAQ